MVITTLSLYRTHVVVIWSVLFGWLIEVLKGKDE